MNQLVVNNQIIAGELHSQHFPSNEAASAYLIEYLNQGLKAGVRRSKHNWIAAVLTRDESSMVVFKEGYSTESQAVQAAQSALKEISEKK